MNLQPAGAAPYAAQGGFSWRDDDRVLRLDLVSPLGSVLARIRVEPGLSMLERRGREMAVGPTEYRLIKFFMEHPRRVFSRGQLLDADSRFLFLTVYAVRMSSLALAGLLAEKLAHLPGVIEHGDLCVREQGEGPRHLPTAIFARWRQNG